MMLSRRGLAFICVVVLLCPAISTGAEEQTELVLKDGSSIAVQHVEVRGGAVVVRLENGRFMQYEIDDVDMAASGLVQEEPKEMVQTEERRGLRGGGRIGQAIAPTSEVPSSMTITDQDVGHVDREARSASAGDEEGEAETREVSSDEGTLRFTNVGQEVAEDQVTLTGRIVNDGVTDLLDVTIVAMAEDSDGNTIGRGTVGISKSLAGGALQAFSLVIPVTSEVANVRYTARATAMTRPTDVRPADEPDSAERAAEDVDGASEDYEPYDGEDRDQGDNDG